MEFLLKRVVYGTIWMHNIYLYIYTFFCPMSPSNFLKMIKNSRSRQLHLNPMTDCIWKTNVVNSDWCLQPHERLVELEEVCVGARGLMMRAAEMRSDNTHTEKKTTSRLIVILVSAARARAMNISPSRTQWIKFARGRSVGQSDQKTHHRLFYIQ